MAKIELQLQREGRHPELICFDSERVLIGSEAYCDVRLPNDEAAPEQLLLEVQGSTLRVTALSASRPLTIDGRRAARGAVASGSVLGLGKLTIQVWLDRGVPTAAAGGTLRRRLSVAAVAVAVGTLGLLALLAGESKRRDPAVPPGLWAAGAIACPATQPREALAITLEKETLADAKAQRQPFIAKDGVDAVRLYRVAAECARTAGASEAHATLASTADSLQSAIDADYRVRRLRLDYSLKIGDKRTAGREASMLRELLRGREDAYTRWLAALDSKLHATDAVP